MKVQGKHYRSIWFEDEKVKIIDQMALPFDFKIIDLTTSDEVADAILTMKLRGAPLIGAAAAYGYALAMREDSSDTNINKAYDKLFNTRPTAINLKWALDRMKKELKEFSPSERYQKALDLCKEISDEDIAINEAIGRNGLSLIEKIIEKKGKDATINILTHCNAGWLATVDWGTALAPIYKAYEKGYKIHVWVDETRPRNQGAYLTAWELKNHGVPHTLIPDNAGGHLMQHGMVDLCFVGTDRTTALGDVCNKIGTYLKAIAAYENKVPFYVCLPSPTIDWTVQDGVKEIPIEERSDDEVLWITGKEKETGKISQFYIAPEGTKGGNYAFDVTPAKYVTMLVTEKGVCEANPTELKKLFK